MRFVDDDEVSLGPPAARERLRAADLDRLATVSAEVSRLHDADRQDAFPLKFADGLVD